MLPELWPLDSLFFLLLTEGCYEVPGASLPALVPGLRLKKSDSENARSSSPLESADFFPCYLDEVGVRAKAFLRLHASGLRLKSASESD